MKIVLIRHTRVDVPQGTCYGWSDVPVAETFTTEATEVKRCLQPYGTFDAVFSSPLTRARKLACFCGYPEPQTDERLKEMNMGDWEMQRYEDIEKTDASIFDWYNDYMHLPTTNGESFPQLYSRVAHFLDELQTHSYRQVAVFAHGGVLVCAGIYGGLFSREHAFDHLVPYGGIEVIKIPTSAKLKERL
ncbi:MAG TPA: alpha-ribazole phosphatase [Prevotella sp.]